jgi:hypothetical protein
MMFLLTYCKVAIKLTKVKGLLLHKLPTAYPLMTNVQVILLGNHTQAIRYYDKALAIDQECCYTTYPIQRSVSSGSNSTSSNSTEGPQPQQLSPSMQAPSSSYKTLAIFTGPIEIPKGLESKYLDSVIVFI